LPVHVASYVYDFHFTAPHRETLCKFFLPSPFDPFTCD
jgi:hypothetical protein